MSEILAERLKTARSTTDSGLFLTTNTQSKIVTNPLQLKDPWFTSRFNFIFHLLGKITQLHNRSFHGFTDEMQMNLALRAAGPQGLAAVVESQRGHKPKVTLPVKYFCDFLRAN